MTSSINSRWSASFRRYSSDRFVDHVRYVRNCDGRHVLKIDTVTEVAYVASFSEQPGWHHGARVRKH